MSAKIKYTDEPLGKIQVVPDFLPSPAELAFHEEHRALQVRGHKTSHAVPTHDSAASRRVCRRSDPNPAVHADAAR